MKPESQHYTICTIDTDIDLEFSQPLDYKERPQVPKLLKRTSSVVLHEKKKLNQSLSSSYRGRGREIGGSQKINGKEEESLLKEMSESTLLRPPSNEYNPRKHKISKSRSPNKLNAFSGRGTEIGGKDKL